MMVNAKEGRWAGAIYEMHNERYGVAFYGKQRAMVWLTKSNGRNGSGGQGGASNIKQMASFGKQIDESYNEGS